MNASNPNPRVIAAMQAWQRCPGARVWDGAIDSMLLARWNDEDIGWPSFEGEVLLIFRLSDSTVIEDEELPCEEALSLRWEKFELNPPLVLAPRKEAFA